MIEPALVVAGPTASGKTTLAIQLALKHGFEIVSVDSRQIYHGMTIGSAAPSQAELAQVPHHLVDCVSPKTIMTAGDFGRLAQEVIRDIESRGKQALFVGGSGMYLRAVLGGLDDDLPKSEVLREQLQEESQAVGPQVLHRRLESIDPEAFQRIKPRDEVRIIRALEVYTLTGKPISSLHRSQGTPAINSRILVLLFETPVLENRIRTRVRQMIDRGLLEEVKRLLEQDILPDQPALKSVGYAETVRYMRGEYDRELWEEKIVINTRRYAKRQRTWFRSTPGVIPMDMQESKSLSHVVAEAEKQLGIA